MSEKIRAASVSERWGKSNEPRRNPKTPSVLGFSARNSRLTFSRRSLSVAVQTAIASRCRTIRRAVLVGLGFAALGLFAFYLLRAVGPYVPFVGWLFGPTYAAVATLCPGDVNGDSQRDIRDVVLIESHVLGKQVLTGDALVAADVNGDSQVDVLDVARMLQHTTGSKLLEECRASVEVTPGGLDFGSVVVGQSKDLTVTVANVGSAALTVSAITSSNPQFRATTPAVPFNMAAGGQQAINVRFTPTAPGTQSGTLSIVTSAATGNVSLAGTGANPAPTIVSLSPNSATVGGAAFTLAVTGTNFVNSSRVQWNGADRTTTFVSATQLTAAIAATDLAAAATVNVTVVNPAPGGGTSNALTFPISAAANPVPTVTSISPTSATAGDPALTLTVNGTNFVNSSSVQWDGSPRATTFVSSTQLTASISVADLASDTTVAVAVLTAAPGGGVSEAKSFYIAPKAPSPRSALFLRYIAPSQGAVGDQFTLLGKGFSSATASNTVIFSLDGTEKPAALVSASETVLVGTVPAGLQTDKSYAVSVTVGGKKTNAVAFKATSSKATLDIHPRNATLLMPPGSGKEFLVVGGGTRPYKLKPLSSDDQAKARVELKGNVLEVTGLDAGRFGVASITVEVQDSAASAATASASVRVQIPRFEPTFNVTPHNLLAGSTPGFTMKVGTTFSDMQISRTKISIEKTDGNFSPIKERSIIGLTDAEGTFGMIQVSGVDSADKVRFDVKTDQPLSVDDLIAGRSSLVTGLVGTLEKGGGGVRLNESVTPEPAPEAVVPSGLDTEILFNDGIVRLPSEAGTAFNITAVFTSVTVVEGKYLPMTKTITKAFRTMATEVGAPQIARVSPVRGEVGRTLTIEGTGFAATADGNKVVFVGGPDPVEATILSATTTKLQVTVPQDAPGNTVDGEAVRVLVNSKASNDHWFRVMFRPEGVLSFPRFTAGAAVGPFIELGQPFDRVRFRTAKITTDDGKINVSTLVKDQAAASVQKFPFSGGVPQDMIAVYRGQETEGAKRHIFDIQQNLQSSPEIKLFLSEASSGKGVVFDLEFAQNNNLNDRMLIIRFDKTVYVPPSTPGATVNTSFELRSAAWMLLPGTEFQVQYVASAKTK